MIRNLEVAEVDEFRSLLSRQKLALNTGLLMTLPLVTLLVSTGISTKKRGDIPSIVYV